LGRINYVCATCSEHFTRRNNGGRHNLRAHGGRAEIVRLIDYLAGRQSGMYEPNNPFWYSNKQQIRGPLYDSSKKSNPLVFQPSYPKYREIDEVPQYSGKMIKIRELRMLLYKHRFLFGLDPYTVFRIILAFSSSRGDDSIIDEKLELLRALDKKFRI